MTAIELASVPGEVLTCAQVAEVIGANPDTIRWQARQDPSKLGFPVIVVGNRVKIPKRPFLRHMGISL